MRSLNRRSLNRRSLTRRSLTRGPLTMRSLLRKMPSHSFQIFLTSTVKTWKKLICLCESIMAINVRYTDHLQQAYWWGAWSSWLGYLLSITGVGGCTELCRRYADCRSLLLLLFSILHSSPPSPLSLSSFLFLPLFLLPLFHFLSCPPPPPPAPFLLAPCILRYVWLQSHSDTESVRLRYVSGLLGHDPVWGCQRCTTEPGQGAPGWVCLSAAHSAVLSHTTGTIAGPKEKLWPHGRAHHAHSWCDRKALCCWSSFLLYVFFIGKVLSPSLSRQSYWWLKQRYLLFIKITCLVSRALATAIHLLERTAHLLKIPDNKCCDRVPVPPSETHRQPADIRPD